MAGGHPAAAHIQVRPSTAAPDDAVLWEVLVPNERERSTTAVELAVPASVVHLFLLSGHPELASLGDPRARRVGPLDRLAGTPAPRRLRAPVFPGLDPAARGDDRVEGDPDLRRRPEGALDRRARCRRAGCRDHGGQALPPQNAGGEGSDGVPSAPPADESNGAATEDGSDGTARWLAAAALVAALASLTLSILRRRRAPSRDA